MQIFRHLFSKKLHFFYKKATGKSGGQAIKMIATKQIRK